MSGHYWTVSHGLRISVGSGRRAREGIWWRKRGPGGAGEAFSSGKLGGGNYDLMENSLRLNLECGGQKEALVVLVSKSLVENLVDEKRPGCW